MRRDPGFFLYRALLEPLGRLPPKAGYWLARCLGGLAYRLMGGLRRATSSNIRQVLGPGAPEERVQALAREACIGFASGHYEFFRLRRLTLEQIRPLIQVQGWEQVLAETAKGRGVILAAPHFGNADIAIQAPALFGVSMLAVAEHLRPEARHLYFSQVRTRFGLRLIPSDGPMLELFRALKRGELIILACDRDVIGSGRPLELFGAPASLPVGPVAVALRTGAPLMPAYATRLPDHTFRVTIEPPVVLARTGDREADLEAGMRQIVAFLERVIGPHPEQWLVTSPIWNRE